MTSAQGMRIVRVSAIEDVEDAEFELHSTGCNHMFHLSTVESVFLLILTGKL